MNDSRLRCFSKETCYASLPSENYRRHLLEFEKNFEFCDHFIWLTENWKLNFIFIAIYLIAIFYGQRYMKSRSPFNLRGTLFLWNAFLGGFSAFAAWRSITSLVYDINELGFYESICNYNLPLQTRQAVGIYLWCFILSKVVELLDTAFIVLRKTPLIFLHWYHHMTVCFFVWSSGAYPSNIHMYFMAANFLVHSLMYSYYALKVLKIQVPKWVNMTITTMQLSQMLFGIFITYYAYHLKNTPGIGCCVQNETVTIAVVIYLSYFILFLNFFVRSYVFKKTNSISKSSKKTK